MNNYANVFLEAAHAASIIPLAHEATLSAMRGFGGFNLEFATALAIIGAIMGSMFNWGVGYVFLRLSLRERQRGLGAQHLSRSGEGDNVESSPHPAPLPEGEGRKRFQRFGIILLPLCFLPLLNFAVLAAGFLGVRARTALLLVALGHIGHYGYYLLR